MGSNVEFADYSGRRIQADWERFAGAVNNREIFRAATCVGMNTRL
jgi:hypothetical protein